jgi:hypothetical protein
MSIYSVVAARCSSASFRSWVSLAICSSLLTVEATGRDASCGAGLRLGLDALWGGLLLDLTLA